jgi:hypothetical protein
MWYKVEVLEKHNTMWKVFMYGNYIWIDSEEINWKPYNECKE